MQGLIIGGVALLLGAGVAGATVFGVVDSATSGKFEPQSNNVLEYGANQ